MGKVLHSSCMILCIFWEERVIISQNTYFQYIFYYLNICRLSRFVSLMIPISSKCFSELFKTVTKVSIMTEITVTLTFHIPVLLSKVLVFIFLFLLFEKNVLICWYCNIYDQRFFFPIVDKNIFCPPCFNHFIFIDVEVP